MELADPFEVVQRDLGEAEAQETALLLVPFSVSAVDSYEERLALISVGAGTLSARGELASAFAPLRIGDTLFTAGGDRLQAFALGAAVPGDPLASLALWPTFANAWLQDDVIARERGRIRGPGPWDQAGPLRRGAERDRGRLAARRARETDRVLHVRDTCGGQRAWSASA